MLFDCFSGCVYLFSRGNIHKINPNDTSCLCRDLVLVFQKQRGMLYRLLIFTYCTHRDGLNVEVAITPICYDNKTQLTREEAAGCCFESKLLVISAHSVN